MLELQTMHGTVLLAYRMQTNLNSELAALSIGKWEFFVTVMTHSNSTLLLNLEEFRDS